MVRGNKQIHFLQGAKKEHTWFKDMYMASGNLHTQSLYIFDISALYQWSTMYSIDVRIILYTFNCNLDTRHGSEMQEIHLQCIANHVKSKQLKNNAPCWISFYCLSQICNMWGGKCEKKLAKLDACHKNKLIADPRWFMRTMAAYPPRNQVQVGPQNLTILQ